MNHRAIGIAVAAYALAALGVAYGAQDVLHMFPCPLCLWERWPYRIVIALGVLVVVLPRLPARAALALALLTMLAGAAIAFTHVGVELHWWPSPLPECNGILAPGAPLPMTPAKPCDQPSFLIPGLPISFAAMDFFATGAFALALALYLWVSRSRA